MKSLVSVNNQPTQIDENSTLAELLGHCGYDCDKSLFAVAVNSEFVPREQYNEHVIHTNDQVDVVQPISGG